VADPRTTAPEAPDRTSASGGAPRKDDSVASQATASSRLVFPSPFAPVMTVRPSGANDTDAEA